MAKHIQIVKLESFQISDLYRLWLLRLRVFIKLEVFCYNLNLFYNIFNNLKAAKQSESGLFHHLLLFDNVPQAALHHHYEKT